ncbi:diphthamide biosynthesis enzyme Dph2 [Sulfurisphaera tokodaii]|uniref:2-(3-amino-3-carboxypropyl)histidine synthase n=2 Tax=Sulfurisphaera tokodaii TaxID=111955 RepID=Q96YA5_SULTO|nr:diphthamide biosynthesis enzyme Dph2 [Sulfurisphaera tokodaii]BAB67372.1 S-adenosyl-L-methionine--L-histidine 3-amino-3-carboxypropyltransferase [Sulfurisphaera tokodaii str. 7]HII75083.1 diphthamide biosynthesis enzyme Dph2 [Sulfurisphaera tokodaii]
MSYNFQEEYIAEEIRKRNAKKVILQFPEGLKIFSIFVIEKLKEFLPDVDFIVSSDPNWGACDIAEDEAKNINADLIIHFGHTPYTWYYPKFPTLFVPVESNLDITDEQINEVINFGKKYEAKTISLTATVQHIKLIRKISLKLSDYFDVKIGKPSSVFMFDGQILGCDYKAATSVDADLYVNISGGIFHALGVGLATGKPIVKIDPYTGKVEDLTKEVYKILKIRYAKIMEAIDKRNWGIIQGAMNGQNRPLMVKYFEKKLKEKGYNIYVFLNRVLTKDVLRNLSPSLDVFLVTSCPRLPIDDLYDFEKPVLTPGEAKMIILNNFDKYIFPW